MFNIIRIPEEAKKIGKKNRIMLSSQTVIANCPDGGTEVAKPLSSRRLRRGYR